MYYQLVFETRGRLAWFHSTERLRALHRMLARVVGDRMLLFGFADDHGHIVVEHTDRPSLAAVTSGLHRAFSHLGAAVGPTFVNDVADARHLANLIRYAVCQPSKHGSTDDAAASEGTCFPDLVGARIGGLDASRIRIALPRIDVTATALESVGLRGPLIPATDQDIAALGAPALYDAALAAFAAPTCPNPHEVLRARTAFVALGAGHFGRDAMRAAGTMSASGWSRFRAREPVPVDILAVRTQLGLRALVRSNPVAQRVTTAAPTPVRRWPR